jgi:hypothetical protein
MTHVNAPLSFEGRRRLVERYRNRPIAHVAAEMGISRACASKWVNRWRGHGDAGLQDRSSTPHRSPRATPAWAIEHIETWRREHKWSAQRITDELADLSPLAELPLLESLHLRGATPGLDLSPLAQHRRLTIYLERGQNVRNRQALGPGVRVEYTKRPGSR